MKNFTSQSENNEINSIVISVNNLSKTYSIWSSPKARLVFPFIQLINKFSYISKMGFGHYIANLSSNMYREFHALEDVSLQIKKGESWGFIGVNGSGKSTLLKIISGNLRPTQGTVEVEGKVAILDYSSGISGEFTGRENIYLKASILGLSRKEIDKRFQSITDFADIGDFINQPVKTYSSGMGARLGFAIMAHVDADILITDEALAVGDAFFVQKCMTYIRNFLKKGTFLFVSHSVNDVVALCQNAVWLENGVVRAIGPAKDVTDKYLASAEVRRSKIFLSDSLQISDINSVKVIDNNIIKQNDEDKTNEFSISQPFLSTLIDSKITKVVRDPREKILKFSQWRNDIQIPEFAMQSGFGVGGAQIYNIGFEDENGSKLSWVIGGELTSLKIEILADRNLDSPIVGFQVKDRLGQTLFADNTYIITLEKPFIVKKDQRFNAEFNFQMPLLPVGDYVIRVAVALGTEDDNAMLHCIDDAILFHSMTSGVRHGLIGVPMEKIKILICE